MPTIKSLLAKIADDGFVVARGVYASEEIDSMLACLAGIFVDHGDASAVRSKTGSVYAARNVLDLWPEAADVWRKAP